MSAAITSILYTAIAAVAGFFLAPRERQFPVINIAAYWVIAAALAFLMLHQKLLVFGALGVVLGVIAPFHPVKRVLFYLAVLPALPRDMTVLVPFPGLNYLTSMDHAKLTAIFVLGPVFIKAISMTPAKPLREIEPILIGYAGLITLMSFRDLPFTSMIRLGIDMSLLIVVPYVCLSRLIRTSEDVKQAIMATFVGLIIAAVIGFIAAAQSWNYYAQVRRGQSFYDYTLYRNGIIRVASTMNTTLLGLMMGVATVMAIRLHDLKKLNLFFFVGLLGLFLFVCFATGSRGAWLATIAVIGAYFILPRMPKVGYTIFLVAAPLGVAGAAAYIMGGGEAIQDEHGTFEYRALLLEVAWEQIKDKPFFGSTTFLESPRFQVLVQGQGIIDLVNVFLQVVLYYGGVGLFLYTASHILPIVAGVRLLGRTAKKKKRLSDEVYAARKTLALVLAAHMGYIFMIGTTSAMSYIYQYGIVFIVLSVAQIRALSAQLAEEAAAKGIVAVEDMTDADHYVPRPQRGLQDPTGRAIPKPYGARFVRRF
ncbi:MAG: O-antigen ligase family protein [Pseudomonadota bacterium]